MVVHDSYIQFMTDSLALLSTNNCAYYEDFGLRIVVWHRKKDWEIYSDFPILDNKDPSQDVGGFCYQTDNPQMVYIILCSVWNLSTPRQLPIAPYVGVRKTSKYKAWEVGFQTKTNFISWAMFDYKKNAKLFAGNVSSFLRRSWSLDGRDLSDGTKTYPLYGKHPLDVAIAVEISEDGS